MHLVQQNKQDTKNITAIIRNKQIKAQNLKNIYYTL